MTSDSVPTDDTSAAVPPADDSGSVIAPPESTADPTTSALTPGAGAPVGDSVVPAGPATRRRRWIIVGVFALLGAGIVAAMFLIRLPYYLISPGSVRPSETRVEVVGAKSYENDGEVLFTTVFVDQATPALMIRAWLDDAVDIRTQDEMYPDGDKKASQQQNLARMDMSKMTATLVALQRLGIDATVSAHGARVLGVAPDAPSNGVLKPNDVITEVDGVEVAMPADIAPELADHQPGQQVEVTVQRPAGDGTTVDKDLDVTLGAASDDPARPVLGIEAEAYDPTIDSPVQVTVDSGTVSGPSAGLAWTLAIIDRMTPGSITDDRRVAVTGEILSDGSVGPIGGIEQKVAAVRRAGVPMFIYPASTPEAEQKAMRVIAGDAVELRPVATLDEALDVLVPEGLKLPA